MCYACSVAKAFNLARVYANECAGTHALFYVLSNGSRGVTVTRHCCLDSLQTHIFVWQKLEGPVGAAKQNMVQYVCVCFCMALWAVTNLKHINFKFL